LLRSKQEVETSKQILSLQSLNLKLSGSSHTLPASVDLRTGGFSPPIGDKGTCPSCTAWAVGYATPIRRLAAVMLADVAGYSTMMERDETGTHLRLREVRAQITDPAIGRHYGRIVRTRGDDMLVEFASAVEALTCAVEIQRAMVEYNRGLAAGSRIEFRIGVNLGDILVDGPDIAGDGVNVAARLEALAAPGEISISRAVREQVRQLVGVRLTYAGEHRVKNISRPLRVFKVNLDGAAGAHAATWMRWRRAVTWGVLAAGAALLAWGFVRFGPLDALRPPPAPLLSLAVLPSTHCVQAP
jgi:class 3 adenylate cyclase